MDVWAVIPVKSLATSKGRLAHLLLPEQRLQLMQALLQHVLAVAGDTPGIVQTVVISDDLQVRRIAESRGALALAEPSPPDLNGAVAYACDHVAALGGQAALILPADLPFVTVPDLALMVATGQEGEQHDTQGGYVTAQEFAPSLAPSNGGRPVVAICGDRHGEGTNGLLLRPVVDFTFHYGPQSMQKHIAEALQRDYRVRLVSAPGLQFDLDTEADWRHFSGDERRAALTRLVAPPFHQ
ncbi:MAG: hypothetical protein ACK2UK_14040 [Candidatus Promineifilaceae bacterium]